MLAEQRCVPVTTGDNEVNYLHDGIPFYLTPLNGKERGTRLPAGRSTQLSFKAPDDNLYISWVCLSLWRVDGVDLTWVNPDNVNLGGGIPANVTLRIVDSGFKRSLNNFPIPWQTMAGTASRPAHWPGSHWLSPSSILQIEVQNNEVATEFLIGLTLVCRRVRSGATADALRAKFNPAAFQQELDRMRVPNTPKVIENVNFKGIPRFIAPRDLNTSPFPVTLPLGNINSVLAPITRQSLSDTIEHLFVERFAGTFVEEVGEIVSPVIQPDPSQPVFVSINTRERNQFITDGYVPWWHVFGTGTFPGYLPVQMAITRNDAIVFQMMNYGPQVVANFGVWGALRSSRMEARYQERLYAQYT
jgi:hypothetical protein